MGTIAKGSNGIAIGSVIWDLHAGHKWDGKNTGTNGPCIWDLEIMGT